MANDEEKGLRELVADLREELKETKELKERKFKFPFRAKVNNAKAKKGYVSVCYIGPNLNVEFLKVPVEENTINVKGTYYEATPDDIMTYKNAPFIVVSSWNERPYSPRNDFKEAMDNKSMTTGQKFILNKLENDVIKPKKKIGGALIWIIVIAIAGYFIVKQLGYI